MFKEYALLYLIGFFPMFFWFCSYCFEHALDIYEKAISGGYAKTITVFTLKGTLFLILWPLSLLYISGKYICHKLFKNMKK